MAIAIDSCSRPNNVEPVEKTGLTFRLGNFETEFEINIDIAVEGFVRIWTKGTNTKMNILIVGYYRRLIGSRLCTYSYAHTMSIIFMIRKAHGVNDMCGSITE